MTSSHDSEFYTKQRGVWKDTRTQRRAEDDGRYSNYALWRHSNLSWMDKEEAGYHDKEEEEHIPRKK